MTEETEISHILENIRTSALSVYNSAKDVDSNLFDGSGADNLRQLASMMDQLKIKSKCSSDTYLLNASMGNIKAQSSSSAAVKSLSTLSEPDKLTRKQCINKAITWLSDISNDTQGEPSYYLHDMDLLEEWLWENGKWIFSIASFKNYPLENGGYSIRVRKGAGRDELINACVDILHDIDLCTDGEDEHNVYNMRKIEQIIKHHRDLIQKRVKFPYPSRDNIICIMERPEAPHLWLKDSDKVPKFYLDEKKALQQSSLLRSLFEAYHKGHLSPKGKLMVYGPGTALPEDPFGTHSIFTVYWNKVIQDRSVSGNPVDKKKSLRIRGLYHWYQFVQDGRVRQSTNISDISSLLELGKFIGASTEYMNGLKKLQALSSSSLASPASSALECSSENGETTVSRLELSMPIFTRKRSRSITEDSTNEKDGISRDKKAKRLFANIDVSLEGTNIAATNNRLSENIPESTNETYAEGSNVSISNAELATNSAADTAKGDLTMDDTVGYGPLSEDTGGSVEAKVSHNLDLELKDETYPNIAETSRASSGGPSTKDVVITQRRVIIMQRLEIAHLDFNHKKQIQHVSVLSKVLAHHSDTFKYLLQRHEQGALHDKDFVYDPDTMGAKNQKCIIPHLAIYLENFVKFQAGRNLALATEILTWKPNALWQAFQSWMAFVKDEKFSLSKCPAEKHRRSVLARFVKAQEEYKEKVKAMKVQRVIGDGDEEQNGL